MTIIIICIISSIIEISKIIMINAGNMRTMWTASQQFLYELDEAAYATNGERATKTKCGMGRGSGDFNLAGLKPTRIK